MSFSDPAALKALAWGGLLALVLTAVFVAAFRLLNAAYDRWAPALEAWARKNLPSLRVQSIEFVPAERLADALVSVVYALYLAAAALLVYLYLPTVLGLFPWTKGLSQQLFGYILDPVRSVLRAVVAFIPNLIFIAVIWAFFHYALRALHAVFREVSRERIRFPGFYPEWAEPTFQIVRFLSWAFALVVVFPYLPGSDSPAFQGISVFLGVLLSLGSGSAVANAVAGVIITYMRPFKLGDRVRIGDAVGDVIEKTLLVTRLRTIKNVEVTIPNAIALSGSILNYSAFAKEGGLILNTAVTIGYDAPWPKVHELLIGAARKTEGILAAPAPFVLQTLLGDFSVKYELNAHTDRPNDMAALYSALHQSVQDAFAAAGVEIMSPVFEVHRTEPKSTVPVLPKR